MRSIDRAHFTDQAEASAAHSGCLGFVQLACAGRGGAPRSAGGRGPCRRESGKRAAWPWSRPSIPRGPCPRPGDPRARALLSFSFVCHFQDPTSPFHGIAVRPLGSPTPSPLHYHHTHPTTPPHPTTLQLAYMDAPLGIGYSATISAPHMHAYALELMLDRLRPGAKVLDVGSGTR